MKSLFRQSVFLFFLSLILVGCVGSRPTISASTAPERIEELPAADSLKAAFSLIWRQGKEAGSVDGVLFLLPDLFGRIEMRGPMGVSVASILWSSQGWRCWIPSEEALFEGVGERIPASLTFGLGELSLDSLATVVIGEAHQLGSVRWEREEGWLQINVQSVERNPQWGLWVRRLDLPEKYRQIDWRQMRMVEPR